MKHQGQAAITGATFAMGYRFQRYWDVPMAAAFFCGECGAGLFLVSAYFDFVLGMIVGLAITGIGKPYFHLSHMGRPGVSWRAVLRPDRSWISRGLIAIVLFLGFGAVYVLDMIYGVIGAILGPSDFLSLAAIVLAVLSGLVVMTYQGFAMSHSSAISLWSTGLMPVASLVYALFAGTVLALALGLDGGSLLTNGALGLLGVGLIVVASLLHGANFNSKGGHQSVELLLRGIYVRPFVGLVLAGGFIAPALLLLFAPATTAVMIMVAVLVLIGYFSFRVLMFKAGLFEPVLDITDGLLR